MELTFSMCVMSFSGIMIFLGDGVLYLSMHRKLQKSDNDTHERTHEQNKCKFQHARTTSICLHHEIYVEQ